MWPQANVGMLGDGALLPLDVDDPDSFRRFQDEHGQAPPTPRYYTGGGPGRERLLFENPGDLSETMIAAGVQLRGGVLMSLVPPSRHPVSGVTCEYTIGLDEVPFAPVPAAWLARVRSAVDGWTPTPTDTWVERFCRDYVAGGGECHPTTMKMAAFLVHRLGSARLALELMLAWNARRCKPPKPESEIRQQVLWAARREARQR
jgi:hypothetical protein